MSARAHNVILAGHTLTMRIMLAQVSNIMLASGSIISWHTTILLWHARAYVGNLAHVSNIVRAHINHIILFIYFIFLLLVPNKNHNSNINQTNGRKTEWEFKAELGKQILK